MRTPYLSMLALGLFAFSLFPGASAGSVSINNGCVVFSNKKRHGHYAVVDGLAKGASKTQTMSDDKTDEGDKCGGYNKYTGCSSSFCANINWVNVSACDEPISSFKCTGNARVKICNNAEKRNYTVAGQTKSRWFHTDCTQYDWGQDKNKNIGDKGIYFMVERKTDA